MSNIYDLDEINREESVKCAPCRPCPPKRVCAACPVIKVYSGGEIAGMVLGGLVLVILLLSVTNYANMKVNRWGQRSREHQISEYSKKRKYI